MEKECVVLCESCQGKVFYRKNDVNICSFCKKQVSIEREVEDLVILLNSLQITTIASCRGHTRNGGICQRSYPWVAVLDEREVIEKAERMISDYSDSVNGEKDKQWKLEAQQTSVGWKRFLVPEGKKTLEAGSREGLLMLVDYLQSREVSKG